MFSVREEEIIKIVGSKKLTIKDICEKLFINKDRPFDAEISVGNTIRRIKLKCHYHELKWTLKSTKNGNKNIISKENV